MKPPCRRATRPCNNNNNRTLEERQRLLPCLPRRLPMTLRLRDTVSPYFDLLRPRPCRSPTMDRLDPHMEDLLPGQRRRPCIRIHTRSMSNCRIPEHLQHFNSHIIHTRSHGTRLFLYQHRQRHHHHHSPLLHHHHLAAPFLPMAQRRIAATIARAALETAAKGQHRGPPMVVK
jgi:hypothetical protein